MATKFSDVPAARTVVANPSPEELRARAARMPGARLTAFGNVSVRTAVVSRSKGSTFLVSDEPIGTHQTMSRRRYVEVAALQDAWIAEREMLLVDGYIGSDPSARTAARLYVEAANPNIAGMQQQLYFPPDAAHEPELTVIYTPNLAAPGWPQHRLIAVDLDAGVTRVLGSDYFGESKKGGLRLWNRRVFDTGGLPLHAGCKVIPTARGARVGLIVGLSGTGKTTTTFTRQNGSLPVQDDFVAWLPDGRILATEAGCFAKTFGLDPDVEPTIHSAVTRPEAYLENVAVRPDGTVDFFDTTFTPNGRATFSFAAIEAADARTLDRAHFLLILNRNENLIPAVARLSGAQAAAYFMLGETQGTSAGGADEAGQFLRVPGTNPFFPAPHELQGNRFLELLERYPLEVYLLNTGSVGGGAEAVAAGRARKVTIPHSSAIVAAVADGTIAWERDPDFGYETAAAVPGVSAEDAELLQPRQLYERQGRLAEYDGLVTRLRAERAAFLAGFADLDDAIRRAAT